MNESFMFLQGFCEAIVRNGQYPLQFVIMLTHKERLIEKIMKNKVSFSEYQPRYTGPADDVDSIIKLGN
eukprot:UN06650